MLNIYIANLGKYNEGEMVGDWLELPASEEEIQEFMVKVGLGYYDFKGDYIQGVEKDGVIYEEYAIHDIECDFTSLYNEIGEYTSLELLNELAKKLEELDSDELEKLEAIIEYDGMGGIEGLDSLIDELDNYILYADIESDYDLGYYWIEESGCYDIPSFLQNYIDYESFGRDIRLNGSGSFTKYGWIEVA